MRSLQPLLELFNARALRERVLIAAALLVVLLGLWDLTLMQPLRDSTSNMQAELASISGGAAAQTDDGSDPHRTAMRRASELQVQSDDLDARIAGSARGFVAANRMIEVLHDVLRRQGGLSLVSLRNLPVQSLVPPATPETPATAPYVHSIELIVEGRYADVQAYVKELESLPWKFRWALLELSTQDYPVNRVRLELSTLSMDATWLGVGS
jgi:MSHA biogenesis protein MshJ